MVNGNNNNEELLGNDEEIIGKARIKVSHGTSIFLPVWILIYLIYYITIKKILLSINQVHNKLINN